MKTMASDDFSQRSNSQVTRELAAAELGIEALSDKRLAGFQSMAGLGIHTGGHFRVKVKLGLEGTGIRFRTLYQNQECTAPALWTRLSGTARSTALVLRGPKRAKVELRTIEHLMAAIFVMGLQDLDIDILPIQKERDICEVPVLDGSAVEWMELLQKIDQDSRQRRGQSLSGSAAPVPLKWAWKPVRDFDLTSEGRAVRIKPHTQGDGPLPKKTLFLADVDFGPSLKQTARFEVDWEQPGESRSRFRTLFAPARTFGFRQELEALKARGLARGGTFDNAILIDGDHIVNEGGFRIPNELAAHKLVDAVGDFALLGAPILGEIHLSKAGHSMHLLALKEAVESEALVRVELV